ncbi:hypothetical protein HFO98_02840 [Rhizobium leguminosarum]|uniref:hypothetical protein n=1 Tax=Rhizobium leguminosarum TaxID=384 RepID=UPI001C94DC39|nr:hypothetical protein [Rhizobium leguminosarum]MBY5407417.1 hypothetical protein [Rhizobium leguminosarum]
MYALLKMRDFYNEGTREELVSEGFDALLFGDKKSAEAEADRMNKVIHSNDYHLSHNEYGRAFIAAKHLSRISKSIKGKYINLMA